MGIPVVQDSFMVHSVKALTQSDSVYARRRGITISE